jgi:hypothetical protein
MANPNDRPKIPPEMYQWLERMIGGNSIPAIQESVDDALDHLVLELRGPAEAIAAGLEEKWIEADFKRRDPTVMVGAETETD